MSTIKEHLENGQYFRTWESNKRSVKGVILLVHGLGEHCERYDALAKLCNERGYHVGSMDLPCHGRSEGPRGHINSFDTYEEAIVGLYDALAERYSGLPMAILGHSMGGLITARLLLSHEDKFKAAMLSGAAIQSPQEPPVWQVAIIRNLAKLFPTMKVLQLDAQGVSRDPEVVARYFADPLVSKEKLSAQFLVSMFEAMEQVKAQASQLSLPLLIMHGGADVMTDPKGSEWLYETVGAAEKTLNVYPDLFHEIFNEPEGPVIIGEMLDWLESR